MKTIEFQVPVKGGKTRTETGKVAIFQIANQKIKFVIQDCGLRGVQLTHFASGMTAVSLAAIAAIRISLWAQSFNGCVTDREACRKGLEKTEGRVGATRMLTTMASAPIINR